MRKLSALLLLSIGITGYAYTRMSTITDEVEKINKAESVRTERVMKRKAKLEKELADLYKNYNSRTEMTEKLRMDSEVRWYRDEYKKILKEYEGYYKGLEKTKAEKEQKVQEINQILDIMDQF